MTPSHGLPPGARIRAAREQRGWTAERLAAELCLPIDRLRALEEDDHGGFGGAVFVRGYLRRAAGLLQLAPQELMAAYESCCDGLRPSEVRPSLPAGAAPARGWPAWVGSLAGVIAVVAVLAGTWWWMGPGEGPPQQAAPVPVASLEFAEPAASPALPARTPQESLADAAPAGVAREVLEWTVAPVEADPAAAAEEPEYAAASVVQEPEPAMPEPGTVELRFSFSQDCWLEVTDADEQRVAYRLYRSGEITRLRGRAPMTVFLGNADGVQLTVDGSPVAVRPAARRDGTARLTVGGGAG